MVAIEPPKRTVYKGLLVQYLEGEKDKPIVVIAKGLGIPGKEFGWMYSLNKLGFNVAYAPYRGTWLSEGEFLAEAEGDLSVTEDISDVVEFALKKFGRRSDSKFGPNEVCIIGDCFGSSPSLVASTRYQEAIKVFIYGGMIYTEDPELNKKYASTAQDKSIKLAKELDKSKKEGGRFFDGYNGSNLEVGIQMIEGKTGLNPYKHLDKLARKKILAMHAVGDNLIYYERTTDFIKALNEYCRSNGLVPQNELIVIPDGRGHRTGFGTKEQLKVMGFLTGSNRVMLIPSLLVVDRFVKKHKRGIQRPDGSWFGVPFYDLVVGQIREFQQAHLLHDRPLEEILNQIF